MPTFTFENPADVGAGAAGAVLQARNTERIRQGEVAHRDKQEAQQQSNADRTYGLQSKELELQSRKTESDIASQKIHDGIAEAVEKRAAAYQPKLDQLADLQIQAAKDSNALAPLKKKTAEIELQVQKDALAISKKYGMKNAEAAYQQMQVAIKASYQQIAASKHAMQHEDAQLAETSRHDQAEEGLQGQQIAASAAHSATTNQSPLDVLNKLQTSGAKLLYKQFMEHPVDPAKAMTQILGLKASKKISDGDAESLSNFFAGKAGSRFDTTVSGDVGRQHSDAVRDGAAGQRAASETIKTVFGNFHNVRGLSTTGALGLEQMVRAAPHGTTQELIDSLGDKATTDHFHISPEDAQAILARLKGGM